MSVSFYKPFQSRFDVLFNNAGGVELVGKLAECTSEQMKQTMDVNCIGLWLTMK
jgi:NADP-dependent 3-hydroxy acid dehydrogenase YdfG